MQFSLASRICSGAIASLLLDPPAPTCPACLGQGITLGLWKKLLVILETGRHFQLTAGQFGVTF